MGRGSTLPEGMLAFAMAARIKSDLINTRLRQGIERVVRSVLFDSCYASAEFDTKAEILASSSAVRITETVIC